MAYKHCRFVSLGLSFLCNSHVFSQGKLKFLPCITGRGNGYKPQMVKLVDDHSHQNLWKATPWTTFVLKQCSLFSVFPLIAPRIHYKSPLVDRCCNFQPFLGGIPRVWWHMATMTTPVILKLTTVLSKHIGSARPNAARAVPPHWGSPSSLVAPCCLFPKRPMVVP